MGIVYRKADASDVELLVRLRRTVLVAANQLAEDADLSAIEEPCRAYFADESKHTTFLAYDGETVVGVGSVDYHTEMPTKSNPTGKCAFLMNIYTDPEYRRRGIAKHICELVIQDAKEKQAGSILLEATQAGEPLYRSLGFVPVQGYMRLHSEAQAARA